MKVKIQMGRICKLNNSHKNNKRTKWINNKIPNKVNKNKIPNNRRNRKNP